MNIEKPVLAKMIRFSFFASFCVLFLHEIIADRTINELPEDQRVQELEDRIAQLELEVKGKDLIIDAKNYEIDAKNYEIDAKNCEIDAKNYEIDAKNYEIKGHEIQEIAKNRELYTMKCGRDYRAISSMLETKFMANKFINDHPQANETLTKLINEEFTKYFEGPSPAPFKHLPEEFQKKSQAEKESFKNRFYIQMRTIFLRDRRYKWRLFLTWVLDKSVWEKNTDLELYLKEFYEHLSFWVKQGYDLQLLISCITTYWSHASILTKGAKYVNSDFKILDEYDRMMKVDSLYTTIMRMNKQNLESAEEKMIRAFYCTELLKRTIKFEMFPEKEWQGVDFFGYKQKEYTKPPSAFPNFMYAYTLRI